MSLTPVVPGAPPGWPSTLPLPSGAVVVGASVSGEAMALECSAPGGVDVRAWFERELPAAGWTLGDVDEGGDEVAIEFEGHGFAGHLEIGPPPAFRIQLVT